MAGESYSLMVILVLGALGLGALGLSCRHPQPSYINAAVERPGAPWAKPRTPDDCVACLVYLAWCNPTRADGATLSLQLSYRRRTYYDSHCYVGVNNISGYGK